TAPSHPFEVRMFSSELGNGSGTFLGRTDTPEICFKQAVSQSHQMGMSIDEARYQRLALDIDTLLGFRILLREALATTSDDLAVFQIERGKRHQLTVLVETVAIGIDQERGGCLNPKAG